MTVYKPSFVLKGILHKEVIQNYKNYEEISMLDIIKKLGKTEINIASSILSTKISENPYSNQYIVRDSQIQEKFVTDNCEVFTKFLNSDGTEISGNCDWCKRKINKGFGVPIRMIKKDDTYIIYCIGKCCGYRCAFSRWRYKYYIDRNSRFCHGEQILKFLFFKQYNGKELIEAPDPDLLKENGGSLTYEEFDSHEYILTPNIIFAPIKQEYKRK